MTSFYVDTSHFDIVKASGGDAEKLLQGQLSCDVVGLETGHFTRGALCSNKGRVIAPFLLLRSSGYFLLLFSPGLSALFLDSMKKFLPFYKASMVRTGFRCTGFSGLRTSDSLRLQDRPLPEPGTFMETAGGWLAMVSSTPLRLLVIEEHPDSIIDSSQLSGLARDPGSWWSAQELQAGHFPFAPEDSGLYTPQDLHYDRNGYVSFTKGCYTGQEIVARMHYRGKIKKQLYLVELPIPLLPPPGEALVLADEARTLESGCLKILTLPEHKALGIVELPLDFPAGQLLHTQSGTLLAIRPL